MLLLSGTICPPRIQPVDGGYGYVLSFLEILNLKHGTLWTLFLEVPDGLKVPCFNFEVSSMSGTPSGRPTIHHLQVGSLEDMWFLTHFLEVPDGLKVPCFYCEVSSMSGRPLSTISRLDLWVTGGS